MKLQIQKMQLIDDIRNEKTFRTPGNVILKLLIFIAVFFLMQFAEMAAMMPFVLPRILDWTMEQMNLNGGEISSEEVQEKLNNLLMDPSLTTITLFCTGAGTILVLLYCRFVEGRKLHTLGFYKKGAFVQYLLGLLAGFAAFSATVGAAALMGGVKVEGFAGTASVAILLTFLGFVVQGMSEEVLCRGFIMTSTLRDKNYWWAIGINAVLFGAMHYANTGFSFLAMLNIALCGVLLSLYVLRTGNLWGACAFHSIWNFAQGNFYGLPVSGIDAGETLFRSSLTGSALANGGDFGLEASLGCTIAMVICILLLLFVPNPFAKKQEASAQEPTA